LLVQDATDLSQFANASKDIVIIFGVLHHIPEWCKVIDEITRVLKPNGKLFLEEPRGVDIKFLDFFFRWGHRFRFWVGGNGRASEITRFQIPKTMNAAVDDILRAANSWLHLMFELTICKVYYCNRLFGDTLLYGVLRI